MDFEETSNCKSVTSVSLYFIGHPTGSKFTGTGRNGPTMITGSDQTVRVVHSCNSWLRLMFPLVYKFMTICSTVLGPRCAKAVLTQKMHSRLH